MPRARPLASSPDGAALPLAQRRTEDLPGHWLLARLGKRVLRPGGARLTTAMLTAARVDGADVVELAPGLGRTAAEVVTRSPRSYVGVDQDPDAARFVSGVVAGHGRAIQGEASATGLPGASADVVVGEAMLTMQTDRGKREILAEAVRLLRPGGRYAIHELGLEPDELDPALKEEIRKDLARAIKVNARPLTAAEWCGLLQEAGLVVNWVDTAPMALLQVRRNLTDEGLRGTLRIAGNVLRDRAARKRVLTMRAAFVKHRTVLTGIALVAHLPESRTR